MEQKKSTHLKDVKVAIDPSLEKYRSLHLFQKKVDRANETLKNSNIEEFLKSLPSR